MRTSETADRGALGYTSPIPLEILYGLPVPIGVDLLFVCIFIQVLMALLTVLFCTRRRRSRSLISGPDRDSGQLWPIGLPGGPKKAEKPPPAAAGGSFLDLFLGLPRNRPKA